jgi:hypothetical protein
LTDKITRLLTLAHEHLQKAEKTRLTGLIEIEIKIDFGEIGKVRLIRQENFVLK